MGGGGGRVLWGRLITGILRYYDLPITRGFVKEHSVNSFQIFKEIVFQSSLL